MSAAYRTGDVERGAQLAPMLLSRLLGAFEVNRLIWASDWPHTQFESRVDYRDCFDALARWSSDPRQVDRLRSEGLSALLDRVV